MTYVELHAHSAYSFLDGASQPEELAARAAELGHEALALTDHDGVYGSLEFATSLGVRTVATGDAHAHDRSRAALQDVLVAVRCRTSLEGCERERRGNHEAVLLSPQQMLDRFADHPEAVRGTTELAQRLEFDLTEELGYRYADFSDGEEPAIVQLRRVCEAALADRYSKLNGHKRRVRRRLEEELALIDELGLAGFFLLHWEVL